MENKNNLVYAINTFIEMPEVSNWLNCEDATNQKLDKLLGLILAIKSEEINREASNEDEGEKVISQQAIQKATKNCHSRRVVISFCWGNGTWRTACHDNSIRKTFKRIICGESVRKNALVMLFCKCFELLVKENAEIKTCLQKAIKKASGLASKGDNISNDLFYCYNQGLLPKKERISTASTVAKDIKTIDAYELFHKELWDVAPVSTWKFYKPFLSKYKSLEKRGYKHDEYGDLLAQAIEASAKEHAVFKLLFDDEKSISLYKYEIISLLKLSAIYDERRVFGKNPFTGITVLAPYYSFFGAMQKEQIDVFYNLSSYNSHNLILMLGEFAKSAMPAPHKFQPSSLAPLTSETSESFLDVYNDTIRKSEAINNDILSGKIRWIVTDDSNEQVYCRFLTAQHRLFFLASADYLRYNLGQYTEDDLIKCITDKINVNATGNHLTRSHQDFLCYSYFLLSLLSERGFTLLNKLEKYADDFSIENGARNKQTAVLMLFSLLISEKYPASEKIIGRLLDHSYGRAVYGYQLLVLKSIKNTNPPYLKYLKEKVLDSLKLASDGYSISDPYFALVASKLGITNDDATAFCCKHALQFFRDCIELHNKTWPLEEGVKDAEFLEKVAEEIKEKLKKARSTFKKFAPKVMSICPAYVYGANILFYSLANIMRVSNLKRTVFYHTTATNAIKKDGGMIYETLIYTDYYTRLLSRGYNTNSPFYLLCGPFRFVCSVEEPVDTTVTVSISKKDVYNKYVEWYKHEKEMAEGGSKRYLLLLTRLLSYTDFFDHYKEFPTFEDCVGTTEFLEYDNMPRLSESDGDNFSEFKKNPRKLWRGQP